MTPPQIAVSEADRECLKSMLIPACHEAVDRGDYDTHDDMQAIARHRCDPRTAATTLRDAHLIRPEDFNRIIQRIEARDRFREVMS